MRKTSNESCLSWEDPVSPKAPLSEIQLAAIEELALIAANQYKPCKGAVGSTNVQSVQSVHQFLELCSSLETQVHGEENGPHEELVSQLENWHQETTGLLEAVDAAAAALDNLKEQHLSVSGCTGDLHAACRQLAGQESRLVELSEQLTSRLEPLTGLEALTERLCNPALSLAGGSFYLALGRLDQALQYIDAHPEYKEAAKLRAQAHFALARAITAMKESVAHNFHQATEQVLALPTQAELSDGAGLALCVGRFQAAGARARQVLKQVEGRVHVAPEYSRLLSDCCDVYIQQRKLLLTDSIASAIKELTVRHRGDHCALLRAACAFCLHVCMDEYHLYIHFFTNPLPQFEEYLDSLCGILYDVLRPVIIHVNHLETLAELCTILRFEMLEEQIPSHREALSCLKRCVEQLLQDVQERLVYRAHVHLQADILQYNPSPGDLAYPEKLIMMESIATSVLEESQRARTGRVSVVSMASVDGTESQAGSVTHRVQGSPADLHGMWYPPVRRVLATLSRLYRCVDRGIFQGLSQEALASCVRSVARAASLIATRSSQVDASLFEMKHLLILREQVAPFHVDFSVQETSLDFTRVKSAVYNLLQKRTQMFSLSNNSLLEFLLEGTPTVKQETVDSRKEVDKQLKNVCEDFIDHATVLLTPALADIIEKVGSHPREGGPLKQQPWFSAEKIGAAVLASQRDIKAQLPLVLRSMQLYLACKDTELLLYRYIKGRVLSGFQSLEQAVREAGFSEEERTLMALPIPEQVQLLLSTASQLTIT